MLSPSSGFLFLEPGGGPFSFKLSIDKSESATTIAAPSGGPEVVTLPMLEDVSTGVNIPGLGRPEA